MNSRLDHKLLEQLFSAYHPPKRMHLDEWADEYRFMNRVTGEKWYTERVAIAKGPMRAITEPGVRTITLMVATQMMKTELLLNTIGYFVHLDPCPILVVQPKDEVGKKFSHVRLKEMIRSSPVLTDLFVEKKLRDSTDTATYKEFPGGHISIVSAKSPSNLAMLPIRIVLLDEIDKYDESSGKEGDPITLAEERMSKYSSNSLSIRTCSPTTKNLSRIEDSYEQSDKRKPCVPCPHCNHYQIMLWPSVKWDKDATGQDAPETAKYFCTKCNTAWTEYQRLQALKKTVWHQTKEFACVKCGVVNAPESWNHSDLHKWNKYGHAVCEGCGNMQGSNEHAGFWANKLYSPFRPLSDLVKTWRNAQGNVERLKTFINTQLAETFEESGDKIADVTFLTQRMEHYDAELPSGVGVITAGVDIQQNRVEVEVVGWGVGEESWSLAHIVIPGDPALPNVWTELDKVLLKPYKRYDGKVSYIAAAAVDMHGGFTQQVLSFCNSRTGRRVWAVRGVGGEGKPLPVWPQNPRRSKTYKSALFYNVGVDSAKNTIFSRLLLARKGPGHCHFPVGREEEWFKQLTAERRVKRQRGAQTYMRWENPKRARNEAFDMRVYAYAALCGLQSSGWDVNILTEQGRLLLEEGNAQTPKPAATSSAPKVKVAKSRFMEN